MSETVQPGALLRRYLAGEHEAVWAELMALGPSVRERRYFDDAWGVARETMRRARRNVELIIRRLDALGYQFWDGKQGRPKGPPHKLTFGGKLIEISPAEPSPREALLAALFAEARTLPPDQVTPTMIEQLYNIYRSAVFPYQDTALLAKGQREPLHAAANALFEEAKKVPPRQLASATIEQLYTAHRLAMDQVIRGWKEREAKQPPPPPPKKPEAIADHLKDKRVFSPPAKKDAAFVRKLEKSGIFLPLSLRAWVEEVGDVNLTGAHPALCFWQDEKFPGIYADPLMVAIDPFEIEGWLEERDAGEEPGAFNALVGWDAAAKARLAIEDEQLDYGYTIELPNAAADARLAGEARNATFVNYLRTAFRWGGFPGWEQHEKRPEEELKFLTGGLLPI